MDPAQAVEAVKAQFARSGNPANIPLLIKRGKGYFTATLKSGGIEVENLHLQPYLPWAVFEEAVRVMNSHGGSAMRGNAMNSRLGDVRLPLDSIEGSIAKTVYGQNTGDAVFRRVTPIACILIWAGICNRAPGELVLRQVSSVV